MILAVMVLALCAPSVEAAASAWIGHAGEYQSVPIGVPVAEHAPVAESGSANHVESLAASGFRGAANQHPSRAAGRPTAGYSAAEAGHSLQLYKRNCVYRL